MAPLISIHMIQYMNKCYDFIDFYYVMLPFYYFSKKKHTIEKCDAVEKKFAC